MGGEEQKREQWREGGFRVCEVGKSSRVAVPWGQCSKNAWVAKVVSGKACFIAKLFLNPAGEREGERQHMSGPRCEGAWQALGRWRSTAIGQEADMGRRSSAPSPQAGGKDSAPEISPGSYCHLHALSSQTFPPQAPSTHGLSFQLLPLQLLTPPFLLPHCRPWTPLPHELVVLRQAFGPAGSTRLNLQSIPQNKHCKTLSQLTPVSHSGAADSAFTPLRFPPGLCLAWVSPTCPVHSPTTRSAMKVSSVSPDRWLTITPQPFSWASLQLQGARNAVSSSLSHSHHPDRVRSRHPLLPPPMLW